MSADLRDHLELVTALGAGALEPISLEGEEGLSSIARWTVVAYAGGDPVDANDLLRTAAEALLVDASGKVLRRFPGIVTRVRERVAPKGRAQLVEIQIESPLALLAHTTDRRIFVDLDAKAIVTKVLDEIGLSGSKVSFSIAGTLAKREMCTQFDETSLAFVERLLAEEGAFHFLDVSSESPKLVFADSTSSYVKLDAKIPFVGKGGSFGATGILSATRRVRLRERSVAVRDQDFARPALDLAGKAKADGPGSAVRESYYWGARHDSPAAGDARAKHWLEGLRADADVLFVETTSGHAFAGAKLTIDGSPHGEVDGAWAVVRARHRFHATEGYRASLELIDATETFRPTPRARPRAPGPEIAFVTGPSGQEIHTDAKGRLKLHFPWDRRGKRDDKSSAWARVMQPTLSGAQLIPRVGWEVLVDFDDGDPDRPIVVGRLSNGLHRPPYALPAKKTVTALGSYVSPGGEGYNELRFDDAKDTEMVHFQAEKAMNVTVAGDRTEHVTGSARTEVKLSVERTITGGETFEIDGKEQRTTAGKETWTTKGDRAVKLAKDDRVTVVGKRTSKVNGSAKLTASDVHADACKGARTVQASTSLEEATDGAMTVMIGKGSTRTIGAALQETGKKGVATIAGGKVTSTIGGAAVVKSDKDLSVTIGGKRTTTIGAAWSVTAQGSAEISTKDALEITVGGALALTGATAVVLKVGSNTVTIGGGGVIIEGSKVKISASGPAALVTALHGLK
jgi:type VI secretion system secreted protein VgrG